MKLAVMCSYLSRNHPLPDGNKRVGFLFTVEFADATAAISALAVAPEKRSVSSPRIRHLRLIIPCSDWTDGPRVTVKRGVATPSSESFCEWSPARSFSRLPSP